MIPRELSCDLKNCFQKIIFNHKISLRFRDDIPRAMKRGELTMTIFADFLKAFNTVNHTMIVKKMKHSLEMFDN